MEARYLSNTTSSTACLIYYTNIRLMNKSLYAQLDLVLITPTIKGTMLP